MPKQAIEQALSDALQSVGVVDPRVHLEYPAELEHGDYASGAAMQYAKQIGMTPRALAEKLVATMGAIDVVEKTEIAGRGFINFHLAPAALAQSTEAALQEPWGRGDLLVGKKVMVDYTQPNPFKPFHIGHLMSNTIGESLSRLVECQGAQMIRVNYQGDVGLHIGKAIWGLKDLNVEPTDADTIGKAYAHGATVYESDPSAKAEIDAINRAVYEKSDPEINAVYEKGRATSLEHFKELYSILGTKFDDYFFESQVWESGKKIVEAHIGKVFEKSEGAVVFPGEKYGLNTRVFITSAGLTTYEGKEMGLTQLKFDKYEPDTSIVVTAVEQENFFRVTTKAAELVDPKLSGRLVHIPHGMMRLESGKMSSRTGDVITGESLLKDLIVVASERAKESRAEDHAKLAEQVAVAAIKYQILKQASGKDIIFDRERALSLEGDSGPYLQYAHTRTRALLEKAREANVIPKVAAAATPSVLERHIVRFPYVTSRAALSFSPHYLVTYLTELASEFNAWYAREQILDGTAHAAHKLAIAVAVAATLNKGLTLLGIDALERM